jgi:biopolymer transport protein TolR
MLVVSVKDDATYYINLGEAEEPVSLSEIGDKAAKIIAANPRIKVLVEGDKKLAYGVIVDLMNTLQAAGAKSVGLITEPPGV